ncbi:unnamed protein product [Chrysoparadoxa australica]
MSLIATVVFWPVVLSFRLVRSCYRMIVPNKALEALPYQPPPLWLRLIVTFPLKLCNPLIVRGMSHVTELEAAESKAMAEAKKAPTAGSSGTKAATGVLFVGNRSMYGLDQLLLLEAIEKGSGKYIRRLYSQQITWIPFMKQIWEYFGGMVSSMRCADELLEAKEWVLYYPGSRPAGIGGPRGLKLMWGENTGFAALAIKHSATIVPFSSLGVWPSLQRQYLRLGEPISTAQYEKDWENEDKCDELFSKVKGVVEQSMLKSQEIRSGDRPTWQEQLIFRLTYSTS